MTKAIAALIIIAVLYGGWEMFLYWEKVKDSDERAAKQAVAAQVVPDQLPGIPYQAQASLGASLRAAQSQGPAAMKEWLKNYGHLVQDPRKAWIELDYCVMVSRENPAEARQIFAEVKKRTPPTSPVWPRIQALEKSYE